MLSGSASRSGAKPSAGSSAPPMPLRPSTNGSSISPRNWLVSWNAALLGAGRGFAGELGQRIAEIAAGEPEEA